MIAVKDGAGFVSCHLHGDSFGDASPHHIPNCCAPEIMGQLVLKSCFSAGARPRTFVAIEPRPSAGEYKEALKQGSLPLLSQPGRQGI